jgi:hypothetical protein
MTTDFDPSDFDTPREEPMRLQLVAGIVDQFSTMTRFQSALLIAGLLVLVVPGVGNTVPSDVNTLYGLPALPGSFSFDCTDCHIGPAGGGGLCGTDSGADPWAPCLNGFGIEYRNLGWSDVLRDSDSDGDGTSNGDELSSSPASAGFSAGAESVGCSMLSCGSNQPSETACGSSNVLCTASQNDGPVSLGTNPTSYNYDFNFSCLNGTSPSPFASDTDWSDRCLDQAECLGNPCGPGTCNELPIGAGWVSPGYDCSCPAGYEDTGVICANVDECALEIDNCPAGTLCSDTEGSFECLPNVPSMRPFGITLLLFLLGTVAYWKSPTSGTSVDLDRPSV